MKLFKILILCTSLLSANNFFKEDDKQMHIIATTLISFTASQWALSHGYSENEAIMFGIGSAIFVGLAKEVYDSRSGGTGFDGRDVLADGIGSVIGIAPIVIYRW